MVPRLFPSWTACDAQSMLKASGALVDGRVDHQAFAVWMVTGRRRGKASASPPQAPRRPSLPLEKEVTPSRSPRSSCGSSCRAPQSAASPQLGSASRTAPAAAGVRSSRVSGSPRSSGVSGSPRSSGVSGSPRSSLAAKSACASSSASAAAKPHRNRTNGCDGPQDPSPPQPSAHFESQTAEPEPEEASPPGSSDAAFMSTPRTHPSCRGSPAGSAVAAELDKVFAGNRLEKAQARHAACVDHLRSVSHLVCALETENARLRAKVRELQGGKNDVVASARTKRNSAVARKTDTIQGRIGCL